MFFRVVQMRRWNSLAKNFLALTLLTSGTAACARNDPPATASEPPAQHSSSALEDTGRKAGEIVTQPARDVGLSKTEISEILLKSAEDPYSLTGLRTCKQLSAAVIELNGVLGPDFIAGYEKKENRAGKLAEAGGKTVINAFIPFRGLVREISGAAPAQRRLNAAIDASFARRGFLRGIHQQRNCKTGFTPPPQAAPAKK